MATLSVPPLAVSPKDDAIKLYHASKGSKIDKAAIINILAHRDATHRALIVHEFKTIYSEEISERLASGLTGTLGEALQLWMHDPMGRVATMINEGLSLGTRNIAVASELICSLTESQIKEITERYYGKFFVHLECDIESHTSEDHKTLLLAYVRTPRFEGIEISKEMIEKDATVLYKAGVKKVGLEEALINISSQRSRAELSAICEAYEGMYGHSLEKAVKKKTSGHFKRALLTIVQCAVNPAMYFAKVLHKALKGWGTDDTALIRVTVTRTEIDMQYIKAEYKKKYKKTLNEAVHSKTSGHYRTFLLSLVGPNN